MAFGKSKSGPGYVQTRMSLAQQMKRSSTRTQKSGGGGGYYFRDKFVPVIHGKADIIRLIPGSYETPLIDEEAKDYVKDDDGNIVADVLPFYTYMSYFHGPRQRGCIGSEGPLGRFKGKGDPCIAADWFWYEWRMRNRNRSKSPKSMNRSERWAFTVLVQAPFYKIPQVDAEGKTRRNPNSGDPYYEWARGSTRRNDEMASAGYESKDGHLMHWSLNFPQWRVLQEYQNELSKHCRTCGAQDSIEELALVCKNCSADVVIFSETSLDEEELATLRDEEVRCRACGHTGYLDVITRCTSCDHGDPATLFDVDLKVKLVETQATGNRGGTQKILQIVGFLGPRPIPDVYGEDLRKSLPLDKIFAPDSLDKQEDLFGIPPSDDDDGSEKPRKRKARDEDAEPPRKRKTRDEDEEEEPVDEDEDDDDRPARKKKSKKSGEERQPVNRARAYTR